MSALLSAPGRIIPFRPKPIAAVGESRIENHRAIDFIDAGRSAIKTLYLIISGALFLVPGSRLQATSDPWNPLKYEPKRLSGEVRSVWCCSKPALQIFPTTDEWRVYIVNESGLNLVNLHAGDIERKYKFPHYNPIQFSSEKNLVYTLNITDGEMYVIPFMEEMVPVGQFSSTSDIHQTMLTTDGTPYKVEQTNESGIYEIHDPMSGSSLGTVQCSLPKAEVTGSPNGEKILFHKKELLHTDIIATNLRLESHNLKLETPPIRRDIQTQPILFRTGLRYDRSSEYILVNAGGCSPRVNYCGVAGEPSTVCYDAEFVLVEAETLGTVFRAGPFAGSIDCSDVHAGKSLAAIAACRDVHLYDFKTRDLVKTYSFSFRMNSIAFTPNGERLIMGDDEGRIYTWDL